jgi:UDP-N-acetylglucosamine 2-epimerase (non-hydrolysing)
MDQEGLTGKKIWILVGTRPDVIKQMPVYLACCEKTGRDQVTLIGTGQHRELLDQALDHFDLRLNHDLQVMKSGGSLNELSAAILQGMDRLLREGTPDWLVVQRDTTSAAMASWAGFQNHVKVAHSEAGLRS